MDSRDLKIRALKITTNLSEYTVASPKVNTPSESTVSPTADICGQIGSVIKHVRIGNLDEIEVSDNAKDSRLTARLEEAALEDKEHSPP